jgi:hypothetical protein
MRLLEISAVCAFAAAPPPRRTRTAKSRAKGEGVILIIFLAIVSLDNSLDASRHGNVCKKLK